MHKKVFKFFRSIKRYFAGDYIVRSIYVKSINQDSNAIYKLTILQRIFMTLQDQSASVIGKITSVVMIFLICLSVISFILSSCSQFKYSPIDCNSPACQNDPSLCPNKTICEPIPLPAFDVIEHICIAGFSAEYLGRLLLVWTVPARLAGVLPPHWDENIRNLLQTTSQSQGTPQLSSTIKKSIEQKERNYDLVYPPIVQVIKYFFQSGNLVDFGAILPYYLMIFLRSGTSVSIIRILRLFRIFRIFKLGKNTQSLHMLSRTLSESKTILSLMFFFMLLAVVMFGCLQYYFEQGVFMVVYSEQPKGAYYREDLMGNELEVSDFRDLLTSFYWAVVTLTTTGYGDIVPHSDTGTLHLL